MRKSTLVLTAAGITAAAITGSAFTASNDMSGVPADKYAGYGEVTVSGVHVTDIQYHPLTADNTLLDTVTFTATESLTAGETATMVLKNSSTPIRATPYSCTFTPPASGSTTITCTADDTPAITGFDGVGLTVVH